MYRRIPIIIAVIMSAGLLTEDSAYSQVQDLLKRVPPGANAIVVVDVEALHKSPLAVQEKWGESHEQAYVDRPLFVPPEAKQVVVAAQLDPLDDLRTIWELAIMELKNELSMRSIARAEGGYLDTINSLVAAWTPSSAYFVELAPKVVGLMYPDNRQYVSRWATFGAENNEIVVSPYLKDAAESLGPTGQIVLAIDLQDAPQPHRLREQLESSKTLSGKDVDFDELTRVISTLQGLTLNVSVTDKRSGELRVDFGANVSVLAPFAKNLLLEAMGTAGATIEDFEEWKVHVSSQSIHLLGDLSPDGMRRIFSLLEIPATRFSSPGEQAQGANDQETILKASKAYFDSVVTLLDDLEKTIREVEYNPATWLDRYARKIDRMPILYVDEDLLAFGTDVAQRIREMALAHRSAGIRSGVRKSRTGRGGYGGGSYVHSRSGVSTYYGYNPANATSPQTAAQRTIQTEERAKARNVKLTQWNEIENMVAQVRQEMTKRYEVEF